jgi:hypothetical protein
MLALFIALVFVALEASRAYMIWAALQQGARESARLLATNYAMHPTMATSPGEQRAIGFDPVRINNMINDSAQFQAMFLPDPATGVKPTSVTVTVTYFSGQYGLPVFPDADILNLGSKFQLQGTSRYTLE